MRKFYIMGQTRLQKRGLWLAARGLEHSARELGFEARTFFPAREQIKDLPTLDDSDILCLLCETTMPYIGEELQRIGGILCYYNFIEVVEGGKEQVEHWSTEYNRCVKACGRTPDVIFNYSPLPISLLLSMGHTAVYLPVGYSPTFELRRGGKGDYDVSFLGSQLRPNSVHPRRLKMIRQLEETGYRVRYLRRTSGGNDQGVVNRIIKRNIDLLNTKVWLHVTRRETHKGFCCIRVVGWGMSNRLCVLAEQTSWSPPFQNGVHWMTALYDDIPAKVKELIDDKERREQIAQAGYEFVRTHWRMTDHLKKALKETHI